MAVKNNGRKRTKAQEDILKKKILELLAENNTKTATCKALGISRNTLWLWIGADKEYAALVEAAIDKGYEKMADEAEIDLKTHSAKNVVATMFILANLRKGRWQSIQKVEHEVNKGKPIEVKFSIETPFTQQLAEQKKAALPETKVLPETIDKQQIKESRSDNTHYVKSD